MGGQISILLALRYQALIEKLVLVAPAGFEKFSGTDKMFIRNSSSMFRFLYSDPGQTGNQIRNFFYKFPAFAEHLVDDMHMFLSGINARHYSSMLNRSLIAMLDEPVYEHLKEIAQPVMVMFGEEDKLIPAPFLHKGKTADIARAGTEQIPNALLIMFSECGHFLQYENSGLFNKEISRFSAASS
jgi:pimeloyl-ACP methyl ester carboxylesterase